MTLKPMYYCNNCRKECNQSTARHTLIWKEGQHKTRRIYYCPECNNRVYVNRYEGTARKRRFVRV